MKAEDFIKKLWGLVVRQMGQMVHNHIYLFCVIIFPIFVTFFFADLMKEGLPTDMPVGVIDLDNSTISRDITRKLDGFQQVEVARHYNSIEEARRAMQRGEIYGFFYMPRHLKDDMLANRQPTVSFYYNAGLLLAGSLIYKNMKTEATLIGASIGIAKLSAYGLTERQIMAYLQPIVISSRLTHNPTMDYNVYLSTTLIPTCLGIFIFLVTAYSIGTELKFNKSRQWISQANGNIYLAMLGKMLPQTILFTAVTFTYIISLFGIMHFPHSCSTCLLLINGFIFVLAAQGFGIFIFGLIPSLRMSMSVCALWSVLSFSICGFTFPIEAMNPALQTISWLFPVRHYFQIYQMVALNGYPVYYAWINYVSLFFFILIPFIVIPRIKTVMLHYVYIP